MGNTSRGQNNGGEANPIIYARDNEGNVIPNDPDIDAKLKAMQKAHDEAWKGFFSKDPDPNWMNKVLQPVK